MVSKENVSIKGTKDGLVFLLNDECSFEELVVELKEKLQHSHQGILTGPLMRVTIKTGFRSLNEHQHETLKDIFKARGNLFVQSIENEIDAFKEQQKKQIKQITGVVRSGQIIESENSILLIGDVNPGGNIYSVGDIYILGTLKGIAHAGIKGDENAIIAASSMEPSQLRIASYTASLGSNREIFSTQSFAFVNDNRIEIEKIQQLSKLRKSLGTF